ALIPHYYTGDIGNPVGFTLVAFAAGTVIGATSLEMWLVTVCFAALLTYVPDRYWRKIAQNGTESLYTRAGAKTPAGIMHLVYMLFIISIITVTILHTPLLSTSAILLFASGLLIYVLTIVADKIRKVI
ncbi:MAG TPA: hypothetical protein VN457_07810, partial [Chlamydiales bacterium]|nr:hypothetical protein [Chlamydiales bacterium]